MTTAAAGMSCLLLGEGDFTYSLDACRFLASALEEATTADGAPGGGGGGPRPVASLTCTGVDTFEELRRKYGDVDFVLRSIRSCSSSQTKGGAQPTGRARLDVAVVHGVDAVQAECNARAKGEYSVEGDSSLRRSFDRVVFNHPHLGTEDARLHSRFLKHLFYAASKRWMKHPSGLLHLTLVRGQCERWDCLEGARRHGLVLLRRGEFVPPPPPKSTEGSEGGKTYYQLRRHQSGRSFASRRRMQGADCDGRENDSETLIFGKAGSYSTMDDSRDADSFLLPWETGNAKTHDERTKTGARATTVDTLSKDATDQLPCPYCPKYFKEQRSLKNHMICSHPETKEARAWKSKKANKKRTRQRDDMGDNDTMQQSNSVLRDRNIASDCARPPWVCDICECQRKSISISSEDGPRVFPHEQALLDHRRAKHLGLHLDIKPDWCQGGNSKGEGGPACTRNEGEGHASESPAPLGSCPVCDMSYVTELDASRHRAEFVPSPCIAASAVSQDGDSLRQISTPHIHVCSRCSRTFRELRALRQHENFCMAKNNSGMH
ncbi:hypothetical protein ACHAWF_006032 [Thalassiosira exigua]